MKTLRLFISIVICVGKGLAYKDHNALILMDVLKKYGETQKPFEVSSKRKQFVAVTVLTETEFKTLPMITKKNLRSFLKTRVQVQYNVEENGVLIHGEKLILDNSLDKLVKKTKPNCKSKGVKKCSVFMFSWYIPCSMKSHTCAQKLKDKADSYEIYIGFSSIYVDYQNDRVYTTKNFKQSFKTLKGFIDVYYLLNYYNGRFLKNGRFSHPITEFNTIFQSNMFDCIIQTPISFCCGSNYNETNPSITNLSQVDKVTAFAINTMVYNCKSFFNKPNDHLDVPSKNCFLQWSEDNIGTHSHCKKCWHNSKTYKDIVDSCIKRAFISSEYIGTPYDLTNSESNEWKMKEKKQSWNKLLKKPDTSKVKCFKAVLHPGTFCTKNFAPMPIEYKCQKAQATKNKVVTELVKRQNNE